jgi:hypothetical protein
MILQNREENFLAPYRIGARFADFKRCAKEIVLPLLVWLKIGG